MRKIASKTLSKPHKGSLFQPIKLLSQSMRSANETHNLGQSRRANQLTANQWVGVFRVSAGGMLELSKLFPLPQQTGRSSLYLTHPRT